MPKCAKDIVLKFLVQGGWYAKASFAKHTATRRRREGWRDGRHRWDRQHPNVVIGIRAFACTPCCLTPKSVEKIKMHVRQVTNLGDGQAAVKLDQIVKVAKKHGDRDEAHIAGVSQQVRN